MHTQSRAAPLPCENIAVFVGAASPTFGLADTASVCARNREVSRYREPPATAGRDNCVDPVSGQSCHSGSHYIARPGVNTNPQCSRVWETKMRPIGPATIERAMSPQPRQQQSTRLRGEALPHGIVAGQPTQHVICRPNAARGLVRAGLVASARYRDSPQGRPCGDPARGALADARAASSLVP
jgi:hypothetical protein